VGTGASGAIYTVDLLAEFAKQFGLKDTGPTFRYVYEGIYLLHELGHYYNRAISDDQDNSAQSFKNTQLVIQNCFRELKQ
jgi:hypothetical protein